MKTKIKKTNTKTNNIIFLTLIVYKMSKTKRI